MTKKQRFVQIAKFTAFSASAGVIQLASFSLLSLAFHSDPDSKSGLLYWVCYLPSLILSVVWNFTFNRKFTFKSANNVKLAMLEVLGYYAVFTPLSTLWGNALDNVGWNEYAILIPTMLINFVTEYIFDALVVFRKPKEKADAEANGAITAEKEIPIHNGMRAETAATEISAKTDDAPPVILSNGDKKTDDNAVDKS